MQNKIGSKRRAAGQIPDERCTAGWHRLRKNWPAAPENIIMRSHSNS